MITCNCFIGAGTGSGKNGFLIPNLSISLCFPVICGLYEWQVSGRSTISISPLFSHAVEFRVSFFFFFFHASQILFNRMGAVFSPPEIHCLDKPHINLTSLQRSIKDSNAHICTCLHRLRKLFFFLLH